MKKEAINKDRITKLKDSNFKKILFDKPFKKFLILIVIYIIILSMSGLFPENFPARLVFSILDILIAAYFVMGIVYFLKRRFQVLMNPKNLLSLIFAYVFFIIIVLLMLSTLFNLLELSKLGYIKYGVCSDTFKSSMISTDKQISRDFFYFTSITFFSVGYGDICPMGLSKILAVITAFLGNIISVILVALIINNYLRSRRE